MTTEIKSKVKAAMQKATKPNTLAGLKVTDIKTVIEGMKEQFAQALPKHISPEKMIQVGATLIQSNPKLAECSASSLIGALMQASILGLSVAPSYGECYLVPYNSRNSKMPVCQFQIGYKGYLKLARNTGEIETIYAFPVFEKDQFEWQLGLNIDITHKPADGDRGKFTHVYAIAKYKEGGYNIMVLTKSDVEKLRKRNPSQGASPSGAWATDYESMACGKAVKQMAKYMPLSDEKLSAAVSSDEMVVPQNAFTNTNEGIDLSQVEYPEAEEASFTEVNTETGEVGQTELNLTAEEEAELQRQIDNNK